MATRKQKIAGKPASSSNEKPRRTIAEIAPEVFYGKRTAAALLETKRRRVEDGDAHREKRRRQLLGEEPFEEPAEEQTSSSTSHFAPRSEETR